MSVHNRFMIEMYIVYVPFWHVPLKYCFPPSKYVQLLLFFIGKTHLTTTQGTYGMAPVLLSCFFFFCLPGSWLLLEMKIQVKPQRFYFICQPHPGTCSLTTLKPHPYTCIGGCVFYQASLTTPKPHPLLLHRRGRVLPSFPKHPQ